MEDRLSRALIAWVEGVRRHARAVLLASSLLSLLALGWSVTHLGVNTHHSAIISDDLPFWIHYHRFAEVFPILDEALLVVVDGETPLAARDAANALAERLGEDPESYPEIYVPGGDPFFERHALLYLSVDELAELSDQLAAAQPLMAEVSRDSSLGNMAALLQDGIAEARDVTGVPLDLTLAFDSLSRAVRAVLEGNQHPISWTELILRRKLPGDSTRRVIVLEPVFDYDRLLPGLRVMQDVRAQAEALGLVPENGVTVRLTGNVALNTEEMLGVARGVVLAALASFALVGGILWVAMRSLHLVGSVLITLLTSLIWTAGFAMLAVGTVNLVSVCFAVLIIGLGVDFGIHFGMRYAELVRDSSDHAASLAEATRSVGTSLALCACTTAMGFYVFIPTDYKAVGELGLIAGTGMLISLFCSLTVLPALITLWRDQHPGVAWPGALWFERIVITASAHHPRAVRWSALTLALLSVTALPLVRFDHNPANLRDPSTESVQTFNELLDESDTSPWTMDLMAPSLPEAVAMAERLRELDVVERAVTLQDYVPEEQPAKLALLEDLAYFVPPPPPEQTPPPEVPLENQIATLEALRSSLDAPWLAQGDPERAESAARAASYLDRFLARLQSLKQRSHQQQELAAFERSLTGALPGQLQSLWRALDADEITLDSLPDSLRRRMLAPDGRARVEVLPREDLSDNVAHARFVDAVKAIAPDATGGAVTVLEFGRAVVRAFQQALACALVAVALLLAILWRRVGDVLLVLTPLVLALLLTSAAAGVLDIPFNFANVVVLPLLLGIGVDSGIHLVHRHRDTIQTLGHAEAPERELLTTSTAQAVFFSALTTMASFGSLAFASHVGFATLGQLLLLGVTFTLLANLIVLPALLAWPAGPAGDGKPPPG